MKYFHNKKSEAITIIILALILVFFVGWLLNFNSRECRSDGQCSSGFYCGSDFACHQIPVVENTIVKNNIMFPSIILGIAIIIAAYILRYGKNPPRKKQEHQEIKLQQYNDERPKDVP